ncbi:metallophosphoesterase [uncultured Agrococcus sp.]|uniref:metallophosphoesterase n=1 Tax=uncultured Agrococcus sp. TaxID=382258 RepID=UPI0025E41B14|nr:metallophosphoesterase [uncultured Agrococcus sp.]
MGYGKHPTPVMTLAHFTDTHLIAGDGHGPGLIGGIVDTEQRLTEALERLRATVQGQDAPLAAIVVSGDVADRAEPEAYRMAAQMFGAVAQEFNASLVFTPGNHDERSPMAEHLLGLAPTHDALDAVFDVHGLRIIALDSTLNGYHHGGLDDGQAEWLAQQLQAPAPLGTVLTMHHPPIPYRTNVMRLLEFVDDQLLADVIRGTDVRHILCGHLHVQGGGTLAGVPVTVAGAISYVDDLSTSPASMRGIDDGQAFSLVEIGETITHWSVPSREYPGHEPLPEELLASLDAMAPDARREWFSRKR